MPPLLVREVAFAKTCPVQSYPVNQSLSDYMEEGPAVDFKTSESPFCGDAANRNLSGYDCRTEVSTGGGFARGCALDNVWRPSWLSQLGECYGHLVGTDRGCC